MEDYAKFPFVLACFWETIRLFPPVQMIPKVAAQDTSITVQSSNVTKSMLPAPLASQGSPTEKSYGSMSKSDTLATDDPANQTSFVVKKGTIVFMHTPGVRKWISN